jgi:hypothetical protein
MQKKIISLTAICLSLVACSSVDSMKVFDQQQAANLFHQNHTSQPTQQMIKIALPQKNRWQKIDVSYGTIGSPVMLIPEHETLMNWSQSIRTHILPLGRNHKIGINQFIQDEKLAAKQACQNVEITEDLQTPTIAIYRIKKANCYAEKSQLQIGKVFTGRDAIYAVYYSAVQEKVSNEEISTFSQVIKTAKLISNPKY